MRCDLRQVLALLPVLLLTSCSRTAPPTAQAASPPKIEPAKSNREIRLTGIVEAVHSSKVLVPQIYGPGGPLTLTKLIANGSQVKEGDLIALFDSTQQADSLRDTQAKFDDLGHQVEQKQ